MNPDYMTVGPELSAEEKASLLIYEGNEARYEERNRDRSAVEAQMMIDNLKPGDAILDAGCGPGRDMERFGNANLTPVGVDLNPTFLTMARRHGLGILADVRQIPLLDGSFAAVWANCSLVHMTVEEAKKALVEFHRLAVDGAVLYVAVKAGETGWRESWFGLPRWYQGWTPGMLSTAMRETGWTMRNVSEFDIGIISGWATK